MSKDEVRRVIGWPLGTAIATDRETWLYREYNVIFEHDRVIRVAVLKTPRTTKPKTPPRPVPPLRTAVTPTPQTAPKANSTSKLPSPTNSLAKPAPLSRPATPPPPPPKTFIDHLRPLIYFLWALFGLIVLGAVARIAALRKKRDPFAPSNLDLPRRAKPATASSLRPLKPLDPSFHRNPPSPPPHTIATPIALTNDLLLSLEWKRFENLCAAYFRATGWRAETTAIGADGGIDIYLYRIGELRPQAVVQCKAMIEDIDVKLVRELYGVMASEKIEEGHFMTTSGYTGPAREFASGKPLQLVDRNQFLQRFAALPEETRRPILAEAFAGDYHTPTCPSCDVKMTLRQGPSRTYFWGCTRYPKCHQKLNVRKVRR